jgi:hypothetical protein
LKAHNAVLAWVHTFTPTFLMDARMGFNRFDLNFLQEGATPGAQLGEALGGRNSNQGPASDGIPIFSPGDGYQGIGQTRSLPIIRVENTFHPIINLTNIRGAHTFKFGFDGRRRQVTQFQTNRGNGRFNFSRTFSNNPNSTANTGDSIASLLLGTASTIEQDFTLVFPGIRGTEFGYYLQDDWKVSDRSFVRDLDRDPSDAAIVSGIMALARKLGIRIVVEGVEDASQLAFLRREGGAFDLQGYLVSRPVPFEQVEALLASTTLLAPD